MDLLIGPSTHLLILFSVHFIQAFLFKWLLLWWAKYQHLVKATGQLYPHLISFPSIIQHSGSCPSWNCFFVCFFVFLGSHDTRFFWFSSYPNNYFSVWLVGSTCSAWPPDNVALLGLGVRPSSSPSKLSYWMISQVTLLLSTIYKIIQLTFMFQALISPLTFISPNLSSYISTRHFNLYQYWSILLDFVLRSAMLLPKPSLSSPELQQEPLNSLSASAPLSPQTMSLHRNQSDFLNYVLDHSTPMLNTLQWSKFFTMSYKSMC